MKRIFTLFLIATSVSTLAVDTSRAVSIAQLLSVPEKFDGATVMLLGYLHLDVDGSKLFLHEADYVNGLESNGIAVRPSKEMMELKSALNHKYVLLVGSFHRPSRNPFGFDSGTLNHVTRAELWSSPEEPRIKIEERLRKSLNGTQPSKPQ